MPPFLAFSPGEGTEGEEGFPWCKVTLVLTENREPSSCLCVGRACFVQCWKRAPAAGVGWRLCRGEGFVLREGDPSAIATPPAAPASPGSLPLPHAPTRELKTKCRMETAPSLSHLKRHRRPACTALAAQT